MFLPRNDPKISKNACFAIVRNVPSELHSKDLRKFFQRFIEAEKFACFHYRHRPELQAEKTGEEAKKSETCCCIVSLKITEDREEFIGEFHKRNWLNSAGIEMAKRCFVDRIKEETDLREMIELKPPNVMPNGNIGTPSHYFLEQIRLCRLPASVIRKLGIQSLKRKKKFGEVPFEYGSGPGPSEQCGILRDDVRSVPDEGREEEHLQDPEEEEWDRHEALHDDVTEQERNKPRKYEEEMEVTWEKGGPGLVWYTDKNYWDQTEKGTDCDWAWADDWDVDYSVYYEGKSAGDMDARAAVEMRQDRLLRTGKLETTVFSAKRPLGTSRRKRRNSESDLQNNAAENLKKGIGGMMLAKMGWKPGSGLGKHEQGKQVPVAVQVEEDGQSAKERTGFGYRGEKLSRVVQKRPVRHTIASVFDKVTDQDVEINEISDGEVLFRRAEPTKMKYSK